MNNIENIGSLDIVQSQVTGGKTGYTIKNIGGKALKENKNVLHITIEDKPESVFKKYIVSRLEREWVRGYVLEGTRTFLESESVRRAAVDLGGTVEGFGKLSIGDLRLTGYNMTNYLEEVRESTGFDVVIVDNFNGLSEQNKERLIDFYTQNKENGMSLVLVRQITKDYEENILQGKENRIEHLEGIDKTVHTLVKEGKVKGQEVMTVYKEKEGTIKKTVLEVDYSKIKYDELVK